MTMADFLLLVLGVLTALAMSGWAAAHRRMQALAADNRRLEREATERVARLEGAIARRDAVEAELRRADTSLREIIDAMPVGVLVYDRDGRLAVRNRAMHRLYPTQDPAALIGTQRRDGARWLLSQTAQLDGLSETAIERRVTAWLDRFDAGGQRPHLLPLRDGTVMRIEAHRMPDGRVVVVHLDVTSLKHAQAALETANFELTREIEQRRAAEARIQEVVDAMPVGITAFVGDTLILRNARTDDFFPHPDPASLIGTSRRDSARRVFLGLKASEGLDADAVEAAIDRLLDEVAASAQSHRELVLRDGRILRAESALLPSGLRLHVMVDLTTERRGSPHVLVCLKNKASYEARLKKYHWEREHLAKLAEIEENLTNGNPEEGATTTPRRELLQATGKGS